MNKKTALITGASSGIGLELAKIHASKGGDLVLVAREKNKLEELKLELEKEYGISVYNIEKDLSQVDSAQAVYDEIKARNMQIDFLINNAGIGDYGFFYETAWQKEAQMMNLNMITLTQFCKLFLPDMIKRGSGKIMNLASTAAFQSGPLMSVYYATKAYVLNFSEAINNEVRDKGVSVTTLCPGPTKTGFAAAASSENNPIFRNKNLPGPKEVAQFGYEAMMQGKAVAIHGFRNRLLSLMIRFFPRSLVVNGVRQSQNKVK